MPRIELDAVVILLLMQSLTQTAFADAPEPAGAEPPSEDAGFVEIAPTEEVSS